MTTHSITPAILTAYRLGATISDRRTLSPQRASPFGPDELAHTTDACHACAIPCTSEESGANYFESHNDPTVQVKRLSKRIEALGFEVTVTERVAEA
ncbi:hypothetical protein [Ferrimicrobium acidiphilum]|uniref:hypothetical protein n=1 Tax=Ferrimicrobium acidiphilum TaxID=121039 RepID=UPI0034DCEB09